MKTVLHTVIIAGKSVEVFRVWMDFEQFPKFMKGVREARKLDERRWSWTSEFAGEIRTWESIVTVLIPNQRIAWRVESEDAASGAVSVEQEGDRRTKVTLQMTYSDAAPWAILGEEATRQLVAADLESFKEFFETHHEAESPAV